MIHQLGPDEASEVLRQNADAAYLDVRTVEEYEAEHPTGAYNVPVVFFDPATRQPTPNPEFERVVQAAFPKTRKLVVGCQSGVRSQRAAEILERLGYSDVANMRGGFGGARGGATPVPGWKEQGLPTERGNPSGASYQDLKQQA
jgi:rhodanese-related sulfurtransferase